MNRCTDCRKATHGEDGQWRCHDPVVNRDRPAFLAGRDSAATLCYDERVLVAGQCGKRGRRFEPRVEPAPAIPVLTIVPGGDGTHG